MLAARIIPCLDVDCGRVVKGVRFQELRDAGDPVERAKAYDSQGADEIMFLDIGASYRSRDILLEVVEKVSREVFVPLAVGGGIRSVDDIRKTLQAGADKVSICTAAVKHPPLLSAAAEVFGSQCVVLSIDAKRCGASWQVVINGGRQETGIDALEWARRGEELGAGEILLNSIDMDGTQAGYDLDLTRTVAEAVGIPVIASGGAGSLEQVADAIALGKADAVLLASLLHFGRYEVADIKKYLGDKGVTIRW